jgi:glycosyltransferase involved in cell wall biosynthesis
MQAVSPIKCGEYLLSGLPLLLVKGIGDLDVQMTESEACYVLNDLSAKSLDAAADWFVDVVLPQRASLRGIARQLGCKHYSLRAAIQSYRHAIEFAVKSSNDSRRIRPIRRRPRAAYVSHDGMLEPLGQSQVVAYLEGLSRRWRIDLFSFEKYIDYSDSKRRMAMQARLSDKGIRWHPMRYHRKPSVLATAYDIARCSILLAGRIRAEGIMILHARGYVSALISYLATWGYASRILFDMRGFWADEKVDGGQWRPNSWLYWITKKAEQCFLRRADALVVLTQAGVNALPQLGVPLAQGSSLKVIPTCADLKLFFPKKKHSGEKNNRPLVIGISGTISNWYMRNEMLESVNHLLQAWTQSRLLVVSREDVGLFLRDSAEAGIDPRLIQFERADFQEMPEWINQMDLGIFFIRRCFSKIGSAATKLGEFLACGVPVVINDGIGDSGRIVRHEKVGIVLQEPSVEELGRRRLELEELLNDPEITFRCRQAAEKHFNLQDGIQAYQCLYDELLKKGRKNGAPPGADPCIQR